MPDKEFVIWQGFCPPHFEFTAKELERLKQQFPDAKVAAHPECHPKVIEMADFVGSTSQIINYATTCDSDRVIVITEVGLKHTLIKKNLTRSIYSPIYELLRDCLLLHHEGYNTALGLQNLKEEINEVVLDEEIIAKARRPLERMLELS